MKIRIREKEEVIILDLEGNISIDASSLVETVGAVLKEKTKDIICNFEGVNLVDYVGVSLIAVIYKNVLNQNGRIKLYNVPSHVAKLFSIVGLDKVFEYYPSEEIALAEIKKDKRSSKKLKEQLRRKFKRVPLNANIDYRQSLTENDNFYSGKVINLSASGVLVAAEHIFSIGDLLLARVYLLPKPGIIEVKVRVVWVDEEKEVFGDTPEMGLEFYDMDSKNQKEIISFVDRHLTHSA